MNDLISRSAFDEVLDEFEGLKAHAAFTEGIMVARRELALAPAVDAVPKWISVKDRLPGVDSFLGISRFNNKVRIYDVRTWGEPGWVVGGLKIGKDITHWMPLPPAPKEE